MGVALVASAAKGLTRSTCKDKGAMVTNAAAAVAILLYPATWMFPLVIVLGARLLISSRGTLCTTFFEQPCSAADALQGRSRE